MFLAQKLDWVAVMEVEFHGGGGVVLVCKPIFMSFPTQFGYVEVDKITTVYSLGVRMQGQKTIFKSWPLGVQSGHHVCALSGFGNGRRCRM